MMPLDIPLTMVIGLQLYESGAGPVELQVGSWHELHLALMPFFQQS